MDSVITELLGRYQDVYTEAELWHKYVLHARKTFDLQHYSDPTEFDVTLSTPHSVCVFSVGALRNAKVALKAYPFKDTAQSDINTDVVEKLGKALWKVNSDRQGTDLEEDFLLSQAVDGSAWLYPYYDARYGPHIPVRAPVIDPLTGMPQLHPVTGAPLLQQVGEAPQYMADMHADLPITYEHADTLNIYPCLSRDPVRKFDYVFHVSEQSLWNLRRQFPQANWGDEYGLVDQENAQRTFYIKLYHYTGYDNADNVVQTVFTDRLLLVDEILWPSAEMPFPWIDCPFYRGRATVTNEMGLIQHYQSALHPLFQAVEGAEHVLSSMQRAADLYGNMPPQIITQDGRNVQVEGSWASAVPLRQGESIVFPTWPGSPPDFVRLAQVYKTDMQEASFSAASMGMAGASASGYQVALTAEASRSRLLIPARQWARAYKEATILATKLLNKYLPHTVIRVFGDRTSAQGYFDYKPEWADALKIDCDIELKLPGDDVRAVAMAGQHVAMKLLPNYDILQDILGYEQPQEVIDRKRAEEAEGHPMNKLADMLKVLVDRGEMQKAQIIASALDKAAAAELSPNRLGATRNASPPPQTMPSQAPMIQPPGQNVLPDEFSQGVGPLGPGGPANAPGPLPMQGVM